MDAENSKNSRPRVTLSGGEKERRTDVTCVWPIRDLLPPQ